MKRDILKVFSSNLIKVLSTVVVTLILPKYLCVDEYGFIKVYQFYASYIGLMHLGFNDGAFLCFGGKKLELCKKKYLKDEQTSLFIFQLIITLFAIALAAIKMDFIVFMWACSILTTNLTSYYLALYQSTGEFTFYTKIIIISSVINCFSNLILIFIFKIYYSRYYIIAYTICNLVIFIYALIKYNITFHLGIGKLSFSILRKNIISGFLLMAGNFSYTIFIGIDKWFVSILLGITNFAYYSFATQLISVINMFITPVTLTLYSTLARLENKKFENRVKRIVMVFSFALLGSVYIIEFIIDKYLDQYENALSTIKILFLSQVFLTLSIAVFVNLYKTYKLQKKYIISIFKIIVMSIVFNSIFYYLYPCNESIAFGTFISMVLWFAININNFSYLKLSKFEVVFIVISILNYLIMCNLKNYYLGFLGYMLILALSSFLFMKQEFYFCIKEIKKIMLFIISKEEK